MGKGKLHEVLAVENNLKKQANIILAETKKTFLSKSEHFDGLDRTYHPDDENGEMLEPEHKEIVTTVPRKLEYTKDKIVGAIDAVLTKEMTNSSGTAKSILKVGDKEFGEFSATALLAMEQYMISVRDMLKAIPTLEPTKVWNKAEDVGKDIYRTEPEQRYRNVKKPKAISMAKATKEHPEQVTMINEEVRVGHFEAVYTSGKITPAEKAQILDRVENLLNEIVKARSKANNVEAIQIKVGAKLLDFIFKG